MRMAYLGSMEDNNQVQLLGGTLSLLVGCPSILFIAELEVFWTVFLEPVTASPDVRIE